MNEPTDPRPVPELPASVYDALVDVLVDEADRQFGEGGILAPPRTSRGES